MAGKICEHHLRLLREELLRMSLFDSIAPEDREGILNDLLQPLIRVIEGRSHLEPL